MADLVVNALSAADWPAVAAVWAEGIAGGDATFEPAPPDRETFEAGRLPWLRLGARDAADGRLLGWAAAGPTSSRPVYSGVLEHSVYVARSARRRGVGRALLTTLVDAAENGGVWTLRSGVFGENEASLVLHAVCGFRRVGVLERVGRMQGRWRDVVLLERRSPTVGVGEPLVRVARPGDDPAVRALLVGAGLPLAGLEHVWRSVVVEDDGRGGGEIGRPIAAAALERHADEFLLRSVVVAPDRRGERLGARAVHAALRLADLDLGRPARVGLLTETARDWFARFGFSPVDRSALPEPLSASAELTGACPASAQAWLRTG